MNADEKKAKQRAFLQGFLDQISVSRNEGVKMLKYFRCPKAVEVDECLMKCQEILSAEKLPSKDILKETLGKLEETTSWGIHLYNQCILSDTIDTDDDYSPSISRATMEYREKIAKSLEARQKHAPGFDGQGGGVGRK